MAQAGQWVQVGRPGAQWPDSGRVPSPLGYAVNNEKMLWLEAQARAFKQEIQWSRKVKRATLTIAALCTISMPTLTYMFWYPVWNGRDEPPDSIWFAVSSFLLHDWIMLNSPYATWQTRAISLGFLNAMPYVAFVLFWVRNKTISNALPKPKLCLWSVRHCCGCCGPLQMRCSCLPRLIVAQRETDANGYNGNKVQPAQQGV